MRRNKCGGIVKVRICRHDECNKLPAFRWHRCWTVRLLHQHFTMYCMVHRTSLMNSLYYFAVLFCHNVLGRQSNDRVKAKVPLFLINLYDVKTYGLGGTDAFLISALVGSKWSASRPGRRITWEMAPATTLGRSQILSGLWRTGIQRRYLCSPPHSLFTIPGEISLYSVEFHGMYYRITLVSLIGIERF